MGAPTPIKVEEAKELKLKPDQDFNLIVMYSRLEISTIKVISSMGNLVIMRQSSSLYPVWNLELELRKNINHGQWEKIPHVSIGK